MKNVIQHKPVAIRKAVSQESAKPSGLWKTASIRKVDAAYAITICVFDGFIR
jgi:hypothetical protein